MLSPILASAVWFFLVQIGVQGQTAVFVLGAVSFAIGLVTDEAVQFVIDSAKRNFIPKKLPTSSTPPVENANEVPKKLEKYEDLKQKGIITETEFQTLKNSITSKISQKPPDVEEFSKQPKLLQPL